LTGIEQPPVKARPFVDTDLLFSIRPELLNDSYIYIHGHVHQQAQEMLIRIWHSTYLMGKGVGEKSELIHAENITYAPVWTIVPQKLKYNFLLIFAALPKACRVFDLVEQIPQPGGFFIPNIIRNDTDVYHVNFDL